VKKIVSLFTFVLLLVVLFATGFQSIHVFSHEHHEVASCCESHHDGIATHENQITLAEHDDCPICDFKFVAFVMPNHASFSLFVPFSEVPFSEAVYQNCETRKLANPLLRGPPLYL